MKLKSLFSVAAFLLSFTAAFAQGRLTFVLQDALTDEPVPFATVSLLKDGSSSVSKYVLSDKDGKVALDNIRKGKYIVKAELLGYVPKEVPVSIEGDVRLGIVKLEQDRQSLEASRISAVGNPIVVKKDTIEYTASSFKTTDNDMLEELLKKLPGVEVSEDGSITANGQTITKITIDGKTFFLDDPQLASKNIPAKIVEKVKVVEKKSEQAEFTGIDDGNEEFVIDLSIHKGMMNGLFGNIMGGGGHDWPDDAEGELSPADGKARYQGAGFIGRFTEKDQISLILNGNNTNNRAFNDLAATMMQGQRGGGGGMGRGQGGWGSGNGITTSWMLGLNGNTNLFSDKMQLGGNAMYSGSRKSVTEDQVKTTYLEDGNIIYRTSGFNNTDSDGLRIGARMEHKFSEKTSILFQPQFEFGKGDYRQFSTFSTWKGSESEDNKSNTGFSDNSGVNDNATARGFLLLRQRLGKPGRTVSLMANYNLSKNQTRGTIQSQTETFTSEGHGYDPVNQRFKTEADRSSLWGRLTYTEPLKDFLFLEGAYSINWSHSESWKDSYESGTYDKTAFSQAAHLYIREGEAPDPLYSNTVDNEFISHTLSTTLVYQKDKLNAQAGIGMENSTMGNTTKGYDPYRRTRNRFSPQARLMYDIDDNTNLRLFYRASSGQPSTSQLMPVRDNTDPLAVSFGNLNLDPFFTHSLRSDFRHTNKKTFLSLNANLNGSYVVNPIVSATWYSADGVQYSLPVNGNDSYNVSARLFLNTPLAKSNFSVFSMTRAAYSKGGSFIGSGIDPTDYLDTSGEFDSGLFTAAHPHVGSDPAFSENSIRTLTAFQRLRLTYRSDLVELTAGGRVRMSKSWFSVASQQTDMTWNNQIDASMNWTLPGGFNLVSDLRYNWYAGYDSGTDTDNEIIVNAEIAKLLFNKSVTLSVKAYDILAQAKNLTVSDSANYHTESLNNTLGRYIVASLTWRFGNLGNASRGMGGPGQRRF